MLGQISGVDEMIGLVGQSSSSIDPEGKVFIRGEYWNVQADEPIDEGQPVEVVAVEGLKLRVRRVAGSR
jgi:membrane-bound serine protease (ClpP class)